MRLEIEISDSTLEAFTELVEESELDVAQYIGRAVDGIGMLLSGEMPGYVAAVPFIELMVDPPELEDEEEEEEGLNGGV